LNAIKPEFETGFDLYPLRKYMKGYIKEQTELAVKKRKEAREASKDEPVSKKQIIEVESN
jgi:hypothetical protein